MQTRSQSSSFKQANPSLNKVQVLYQNPEGIELAQWLSQKSNRDLLTNKRILYVVRANIDNALIKFGVGGVEHGGTFAYDRLKLNETPITHALDVIRQLNPLNYNQARVKASNNDYEETDYDVTNTKKSSGFNAQ